MPSLFKKTIAPRGNLDFARLKELCIEIKKNNSHINFETISFLQVITLSSHNKEELEKTVRKIRDIDKGVNEKNSNNPCI